MADRYNSTFAALVGKLNGFTRYAVTISQTCTCYSVSKEEVSAPWRLHEEDHKSRIARMGWWNFMFTYFWHLLLHGYRDSDIEKDARQGKP